MVDVSWWQAPLIPEEAAVTVRAQIDVVDGRIIWLQVSGSTIDGETLIGMMAKPVADRIPATEALAWLTDAMAEALDSVVGPFG